jgi:hypothetical protein
MNPRRAFAALVIVPAVLASAACTSSGKGKGSQTTSASSAGTTASALSAHLKSATDKLSAAHFSLNLNFAGQALPFTGDETLQNGTLRALDITGQLPSNAGSIEVISLGGKTYAKLPAAFNGSGKPYLLVTPNSSNAIVKQLASGLDIGLFSISLGSMSVFVAASKSIDAKGAAQVGGAAATHYSITVDTTKLPATFPGRDKFGASTVPLELYVDGVGRPVKMVVTAKVQGQDVSSTATVSSFNKPVNITAPPASQVGR